MKETPKDSFEEMAGTYWERKETFSKQQERQLVHVVIILANIDDSVLLPTACIGTLSVQPKCSVSPVEIRCYALIKRKFSGTNG